MNELPTYQKLLAQKAKLAKQGVNFAIDPSVLYSDVYLAAHSMLQDQWHDMMERSEFQHVHAMASEVHRQVSSHV